MFDIVSMILILISLTVAGYLAHCIETDAFDEYTVFAIPAMLLLGGLGTVFLCMMLSLSWG